jgi:hypothetical protein
MAGGIAALVSTAACGGSTGESTPTADAGRGADASNTVSDAASAMDAKVDGVTQDARGSGSDGAGADGASADAGPTDAGPTDASVGDTGAGCSVSHLAGAARSTGFSGTNTAFDSLFDSVPCTTPADCVPSCMAAGGTMASCSTGSLCLEDTCPDGGTGSCLMCLPPAYWLDPTGALGQPGSGTSGTPADDTQVFDNGYNDTLQVTQFGIALPAGATVRGIRFTVDRVADDDNATDQSVRVLKAGAATGTDHATSTHWPLMYTPTPYGSALDLWGATWTAADVESSGFGIAITPQYLITAGNDHVDIDSVTATVFYGGTPGCP